MFRRELGVIASAFIRKSVGKMYTFSSGAKGYNFQEIGIH